MIFNLFYYLLVFYFLINVVNKIKLNYNCYINYKKSYVTTSKVNSNDINNQKPKIESKQLNGIIGLESVKKDLTYYMDFIKNSSKYSKWNVKLPRGILLVGPPGTGKTLLVKTLAKEINVPIIHTSGSSFVEKYVGVGASRVRTLFENARKLTNCIIFIDEIDAIGKNRESGDSNSERDSTLNQLLVEMDGFKEDSSIIVFGATNLVRNLDKALLRSGRFDKKIYFDPPNKEERIQMYKMYLKKVPKQSINYNKIAELSAGVNGADIANICNQAKINAIQEDKEKIEYSHLEKALDEIMIGREKPERKMTPDELKRVAYHEAGHALMGYILAHSEPPIKVSILPRGENALGFSQPKPTDNKLYTSEFILSHLCVLLAGRGAEKIFYQNYSSGAHDDITRATHMAGKYLFEWGMSESTGPVNYLELNKNLSEKNLETLKNFIKKVETFTENILVENKSFVENLACKLLDKETIVYDDINKILPANLKNKISTFPTDLVN
jgi:ATP-dependent metalloprotease FtsH